MSGKPVSVAGVGMSKFRRPKSYDWDYPDMLGGLWGAAQWYYLALPGIGPWKSTAALEDAGIAYSDVQAVVCSYCYGEPTSGQRAVYELGLTGVPVYNVNNNCSSGSSALQLARLLIQSGNFDCVMAVGFEKMESGLTKKFEDRVDPAERHFQRIEELYCDGQTLKPLKGMNRMTSEVIRMFALAAHEYMNTHPDTLNKTDLAKIAIKNRQHGLSNQHACFHRVQPPPLEKVLNDRMLCDPITAYQSAMTADGSAAAVLCSDAFQKHRLSARKAQRTVPILAQVIEFLLEIAEAIEPRGFPFVAIQQPLKIVLCRKYPDYLSDAFCLWHSTMCTDLPGSFNKGYKEICGYEMSKRAADQCYATAGATPSQIDVSEVHDCFSINEFLMYEALGYAAEGQGTDFFRNGVWTKNAHGGQVYRCNRVCVNPSGGIESKGHPIGATGLGQCTEMVNQLRNECGTRQVPNSSLGLQHNFGIGGAAVVTMYGANPTKSRL